MDTNEIVRHANDITLEADATASAMAEGDASKSFCDIWPTGKQGLEMLRDLIKNPIAKGAISIVIAAGDAVSSKVCH